MVFGHEVPGTSEDIGEGLQGIRPGDRVVLSFNISHGLLSAV